MVSRASQSIEKEPATAIVTGSLSDKTGLLDTRTEITRRRDEPAVHRER